MIISVHSCSIDLFKVYSRKQEIKNTKKRKDIYKTVVCCCILLRCEGNWADTKHGEKIQSVEVSTVESVYQQNVKYLDQHHQHIPAHSVMITTDWSCSQCWWWHHTSHTGDGEEGEPRSSCSSGSVLPRHSAQTGHSVEAGAGLCWRSRRLCCATPPPPLLCAPPAQVNPGPGLWLQYRLMEAILWTHGDCLSVFLLIFGLCVVATWLQLTYTHKKSFSVTQNINRFV